MKKIIGNIFATNTAARLKGGRIDRYLTDQRLLKLTESVLVLLFLFLLYHRETAVMNEMRGSQTGTISALLTNYLQERQLFFLPGRFWLLAWPLTLVGAAFLIANKRRWYFLAGTGCLTAVLLAADRLFHHYFAGIVSSASFGVGNQVWDVRHSLSGVLPWADVAWILVFLVFAVYGFVHRRLTNSSLALHPGSFAFDKLLGGLCLLLALYAAGLAFYIPNRFVAWDMTGHVVIMDEAPRSGQNMLPPHESSHREFALLFGLLNFHMHDVWTRLTQKPEPLSEQGLARAREIFSRKYELNQKSSPFAGVARGRNVFLISVESFQHFLLGLELDGVEVTPTLNRLREQALSFEHIIDHAKLGGTSDAEFSLMTGLLSDITGIASLTVPTQVDLVALPETLRQHGYATLSMHAHRISFWNRNLNHPRYGIEKMIFEDKFPSEEVIGLGVGDDVFLQRSLDYLKPQSQPFFSFLICFSSHHPYLNPPPESASLFPSLPADSQARAYLRLAHYSDLALNNFLEAAREAGFWENSLFIFFGDHIAPMGEHEVALLNQQTGIDIRAPRHLRIPMLFLAPGLEPLIQEQGAQYAETVGALPDIFPSICHLLGIEVPYGVFGTHLFVPNKERDPMVMLRWGGGFFYNGILYRENPANPYRDASGLAFGPESDLLPPGSQVHKNMLQDFALHFDIFQRNAQAQAIRLRKTEK